MTSFSMATQPGSGSFAVLPAQRVMFGPEFVSRRAGVSVAHVGEYREAKLSGDPVILTAPILVHGNTCFSLSRPQSERTSKK
jgi:hypothetical protein